MNQWTLLQTRSYFTRRNQEEYLLCAYSIQCNMYLVPKHSSTHSDVHSDAMLELKAHDVVRYIYIYAYRNSFVGIT